jgi:hypothetical protein
MSKLLSPGLETGIDRGSRDFIQAHIWGIRRMAPRGRGASVKSASASGSAVPATWATRSKASAIDSAKD